LGTSTVSYVLLLLTQVFALGLITWQAVTSSVEGETSGWDFEVLEKILMLVGFELTAWLSAVHALADLLMDSSDDSFLLTVDSVVVSKSLKFHAAKTSLEVKLWGGWLLSAVLVAIAVVVVALTLIVRHHRCVLSPAVVQVRHVVFHSVVWLVVLVAAVVVLGLLLVVQEDWVVSISVVLLVGFILRVAVLIVVVVSHARLVIKNVALFTEHHHLTSDGLVDKTVALVD
jgi:hypothetical protein